MKLNDKLEFIKGKPARNRIALPPMDTLMAEDGMANEFHIQHYGARSYGGVGTIIVESTAVSSEGKIRPKDLGLWKDEQIKPISQVAKVIKMGGAIAGVQLNHAGSKSEVTDENKIGATFRYDYLDQTNLSLITEGQIKEVENKFVVAAKRAKEAGFDFVELHGAHGYLLNELMHPVLNEVNKSQNILERGVVVINIIKRIHDEVNIPVGIRLSISDHTEVGMEPKDYEPLLKQIEPFIAYLNISSGETLDRARSDELIKKAGTKLFRIPLAKQVKEMVNVPVLVAGNVSSRNDVEEILAAGIDGVLVGREQIWDPNFAIHALNSSELNDEQYHWNNNLWYSPKRYIDLMEMLKLK